MSILKVVCALEQTSLVQYESSLSANQLHVHRKWRHAEVDLSHATCRAWKRKWNYGRQQVNTITACLTWLLRSTLSTMIWWCSNLSASLAFAVSFWIGSGYISVAELIESSTVARRHICSRYMFRASRFLSFIFGKQLRLKTTHTCLFMYTHSVVNTCHIYWRTGVREV